MPKENKTKKENLHANHRQRLKTKFLNDSLENFAEHEMLELLLFYSIPQADTNPIAHELIKKFYNLHNVFDASIDNLTSIDGIGLHSAILIKLIPAIMQVYNQQSNRHITKISNQIIAMEYVSELFKGISREEFFIICLNAKNEIIGSKKMSTGNSTKVEVQIRDVTNYIFKNNCERVILAHNHPHGNSEPSDEDLVMTHRVFNSCVLNDIDVLDHIIYSDEGCFSFAEQNIMSQIKRDVLMMLKYNMNSSQYKKFSTSVESYVIKDHN